MVNFPISIIIKLLKNYTVLFKASSDDLELQMEKLKLEIQKKKEQEGIDFSF